MTDNEIIKALECCTDESYENCNECPYSTDTLSCERLKLLEDSLELINRQKAEIDSAKAEIEICAEVIERQDAEIKRVKERPKCKWGTCNCSQITAKVALDLINRQKEEIEALYRINAKSEKEIYEIRKELLSKENLEESFKRSVRDFDKRLEKTVKLERVYAYKEFAGIIKDKWLDNRYDSPDVDFDDFIDNLLKEMVGEEK